MTRRKPIVSVCIPTYNRPEFLRQAMESVFAQSFSDYELIISDNASEDSTAAVISSFKDCRIKHIRNAKNIGIVNNFNNCLAVANGQYITIFHDDDLMLPDNLSLKVRALDFNERVGMVHSNFNIIDEKGSITKENANLSGVQTKDFIETGSNFLRRSLLGTNSVIMSSVFIRKECFTKLGGFSNKVLYTSDFEYWMRISTQYDIFFLATPLIHYRIYQYGWTSSQYATIISGVWFNNLKGLQEEYTARQIILRKSKFMLDDWKNINRMVRKRMIDSVNLLIEKTYLNNGEKGKALKSVIQVWWEFPDLMFEISTATLIVKVLLGLKITRVLKGLVMTARYHKRRNY